MYIFPQSASNGTVYVVMRNSSGGRVTNLAYNSPGALCYYLRPLGSPVQITLISLANAQSAHADGGFVQVNATNMPGLYRLDLPDAAIDDGENDVIVQIAFTGAEPTTLKAMLDPYPSVVQGKVVADGGNTASTFKTNLAFVGTDAHKNALLVWRTGALVDQVQKISAANPTTDFITVAVAFTAAPATDDEFVIINR